LSLENKEELNDGLYTFGPLLVNLKSKIQKINKNYKMKLIEDKNISLAKDISIIALGKDGYKNGQGVGSQYLAELYVDFGIIGVIIYSLLLGFLIFIVSNFYKFGILGYSLSLLLIKSILYLPRDQAIQPLNLLLSINYWLILILIVLFIKILTKYKQSKCIKGGNQ